jgi:hypothetical protein
METSSNEELITWHMVTEVIKLSKLQIRNILATVNQQIPEPDDEPAPVLLMALLLAEMLENINLTAEQRALILTESAAAWQGAAAQQFTQICLVDGLYCVWSGGRGFLDLSSGEVVVEPLVPPLETISYNLLELYNRGKRKISQRNGHHADRRQNSERDVEKPADVRDCPADSVS